MALEEAKNKLLDIVRQTGALSQLEKITITSDPYPCIAYCSSGDRTCISLANVCNFTERYMGFYRTFGSFCTSGPYDPADFTPVLAYDESGVYVFTRD